MDYAISSICGKARFTKSRLEGLESPSYCQMNSYHLALLLFFIAAVVNPVLSLTTGGFGEASLTSEVVHEALRIVATASFILSSF